MKCVSTYTKKGQAQLEFSTWAAYEPLPLTREYLNSVEFLSSTGADSGRYRLVWGWQLKRGRKVLGGGYEHDVDECSRKAISLGWPKPNVAYCDKYKQWHTPLPEDSVLLNAVQRGEVKVVLEGLNSGA